MKKSLLDTFQTNQRLANWSLKILISLMVVCLAVSVMQFGERLAAGQNWSGWYIPILAWLISLEAMITKEKTQDLDPLAKLLYHVSEWIIFAIIVKVVHYLIVGTDLLWIDLPQWQQNLASFFTGDYLPIMVVLFLTWALSGSLTNDMVELQTELTDFKWELGKLENNRQAARQRMAEKIFVAGGIMIFITMLTRLDLQQIWGEMPASTASIANVLVYFFLTLAFLSITQFSLLRGKWFWNQTPIAPGIGKNWLKFSLIFFAILAAIAFILPTRYTFGFLEVLYFVFNLIVQVAYFFISLLALPCGWLFSLLGLTKSQPTVNTPLQLPKALTPEPGGPPVAWWELVKSILFWAIFVGIIVFAFINYFRQHPRALKSIRAMPGFGWLFRTLQTILNWLRGINTQLSATISSGWKRIFGPSSKTSQRNLAQLFNFKRLSPRQKVIFYYLRLLDKSKSSGIDRKPYQTPDQFASRLEQFVPEEQQDIHAMTDTFVEARYSNHPIGDEHTNAAQRLWRKIVRSLKPQKSKI